ncbi:hypothetical protein LCGC14_2505670, partial [marine sediment metagenome]
MVFPTASFLFPTFLSKQTELKKISPKGAKNAKNFSCFSFARFATLREKNKIQINFATKDTNSKTKTLRFKTRLDVIRYQLLG